MMWGGVVQDLMCALSRVLWGWLSYVRESRTRARGGAVRDSESETDMRRRHGEIFTSGANKDTIFAAGGSVCARPGGVGVLNFALIC